MPFGWRYGSGLATGAPPISGFGLLWKYPDGSLFIAMKSLSYFEDAELDPMPELFEKTDWDTVKATICGAIADL